MHELEDYILSLVNNCSFEIVYDDEEVKDIQEIYDNCTLELEQESEEGLERDWEEITDDATVTENQIKKIYYELRKNKDKLSFTDADLIIKTLINYND